MVRGTKQRSSVEVVSVDSSSFDGIWCRGKHAAPAKDGREQINVHGPGHDILKNPIMPKHELVFLPPKPAFAAPKHAANGRAA